MKWRIDKHAAIDCGHSRTSGAIVDENGEPIVIFDPSESEYAIALDPDSNDARLICAAPQMLAALEAARPLLIKVLGTIDYQLSPEHMAWETEVRRMTLEIDAAIRAARGE
jgi:hypothetical protein